MGVSKNNGTPKSSFLIGFGTIIFTIHFGGFFPLFLVQHPYPQDSDNVFEEDGDVAGLYIKLYGCWDCTSQLQGYHGQMKSRPHTTDFFPKR